MLGSTGETSPPPQVATNTSTPRNHVEVAISSATANARGATRAAAPARHPPAWSRLLHEDAGVKYSNGRSIAIGRGAV